MSDVAHWMSYLRTLYVVGTGTLVPVCVSNSTKRANFTCAKRQFKIFPTANVFHFLFLPFHPLQSHTHCIFLFVPNQNQKTQTKKTNSNLTLKQQYELLRPGRHPSR